MMLKLIEEFQEDLELAGLSERTIRTHVTNAELFLNDFLVMYEGETMEEGMWNVGGFLGNWFIRKCMWSSPSNIKTTATSIEKFYKSMMDHGHITKGDHQDLVRSIKEGLPDWQYWCALYNDPDVPLEDALAAMGVGIW